MSSDEGSVVPSPVETSEQWVSQDDDNETLWEVIEITAERGKRYKVKWAGLDPKTGKSWPQSWVAKRDCTPVLVAAWKLRQAKEKKATKKKESKESASIGTSRPSAVYRGSAISKTSIASSSTTGRTRSTRSSATAPAHDPNPITSLSRPGSSTRPKPKRRRSSIISSSSELPEVSALLAPTPSHPKKKRKVDVEVVVPEPSQEQSSYEVVQAKKFGKVLPPEEEEWETELRHHQTQAMGKGKGKGEAPAEIPDAFDDLEQVDHPTPGRKTKATRGPEKRDTNASKPTSSSSLSKGGPSSSSSLVKRKSSPRKRRSQNRVYEIGSDDDNVSPKRHPRSRFAPVPSDPAGPSNLNGRVDNDDGHDINFDEPDANWKTPSPRLSPNALSRLKLFDSWELNVEHNFEQVDMPPHSHDSNGYDYHRDFNDQLIAPEGPHFLPALDSRHKAPSLPVSPNPIDKDADGVNPKVLNHTIRKNPTGDDSFRNGIVPETQTDSINNSQSQSHLPPVLRSPHSPPILPPFLNPIPPTTPRSSIVSRMKPKTPGSFSSPLSFGSPLGLMPPGTKVPSNPVDLTMKPLRPVPVVTPSKFTPHLPSSLLPHHDELEDEARTNGEGELDYPMSSIEQFSSPEKGQAQFKSTKVRGEKRKLGNAEGTDVQARGQELAEAAKLQRMKEKGQKLGPKRTLSELLNQDKGSKDKGKSRETAIKPFGTRIGVNAGLGRLPFEKPAGETEATEESTIVQAMEDAYVDLSGGGGMGRDVAGPSEVRAENDPRILLRQEDEENTQDMMQDLAKDENADAHMELGFDPSPDATGIADVDPVPVPELETNSIEAGDSAQVEAGDTIEIFPSSLVSTTGPTAEEDQPAALVDSSGDPAAPLVDFRPKSRSNSKSISEHNTRAADEVEVADLELPPTAPTRQNTPELPASPRSQTNPPTQTRHLGAALTLLNTKSEEISKLDHMLTAEQAKSETLSKEVKYLQNALALANIGPDPNAADLERQLTESQQHWATEKAAWDAERSALTASAEAATNSKVSAEKDRDFFREQYMQASEYASSVRTDNADLEKQAKIARSQAADGVVMIKQTYELRVKMLEAEVEKWKNLASVLMEKDRRTGDEIRERAAAEPELRVRCSDLEDDLEYSSAVVAGLEKKVAEFNNEKETWARESTRLNTELEGARLKLEKSGMVEVDEPTDMVYRCQWRAAGSNEACEGVFLNIEDLQMHLYTAGHIHD